MTVNAGTTPKAEKIPIAAPLRRTLPPLYSTTKWGGPKALPAALLSCAGPNSHYTLSIGDDS